MQTPSKNVPESCTYMEPTAYNLMGVSDLVKDLLYSRLSTMILEPPKQGTDTAALVHQTVFSSFLPSTFPITSEEERDARLKFGHQETTVHISVSLHSSPFSLSFLIYTMGIITVPTS